MLTLGIETSCDETAAAVVANGTRVCSSVVSSSVSFHAKYGGIVPEIAFRRQAETIVAVCAEALAQVRQCPGRLEAVCVTSHPGLAGSLLVGGLFAEAFAFARKLPLIAVDHLRGHIYAPFLSEKVPLPAVALVVSGGHTSLYRVRTLLQIEPLGHTRDDACGEAFDKVAKLLGLGYPGGPAIERQARRGDPEAFRFSCSGTSTPFDFSFSGIKTAVLHTVLRRLGLAVQAGLPGPNDLRRLPRRTVSDICASFQHALVGVLMQKAFGACAAKRTPRLLVSGGVAVNGYLRRSFLQEAKKQGIRVFFPEPRYCTDNAAMIAGYGFHLARTKRDRP